MVTDVIKWTWGPPASKNFKLKIMKTRTGCQRVRYLYYCEILNWAAKNSTGSHAALGRWVGHSWFRLNFVKNLCLNYYSRYLVLFNFRGDNARVFQRVFMNLKMTGGQVACQILCRYTQSTLAASCVCWIVDCYVLLYQKNLWLTGGRGANRPPAKLNVKTAPLPSLYFGIYYSFGFSRLLFFCVFRSIFRWFPVFVWPFNIGFAIVSQLFSEC